MLFFFKETPIEIKAYVKELNNSIKEFSPIIPARECFPSWWKNTPSSSFNWDDLKPKNTVKSCPGIVQTLTSGFILPLWSDLAIEYNDEHYRYQFSDNNTRLSAHPSEQAPGFCEDYWKFKIHSPWIFSTPVRLLFTSPFYHNTSSSLPFIVPPAIIPPVKELCASSVFLFAKKEKKVNRILLKNGTPLLHIIPLTDKKVTIKCETLSETEYSKWRSLLSFSSFFNNKGLKNLFKDKNM